jgi:DnaK suppressor protein
MGVKQAQFDAAFLEKQRQQLLRLRASLVTAVEASESDETEVRRQSAGESLEMEDDAQRLDALERDDNLVARNAERLERVDRALKKIEEGTYGLSDMSGLPIPQARLEVVPDALYTSGEEDLRERTR